MQVDGFLVEKFKCRVSGTIEITEEEGKAMPLDRIVVMLVAARSDNFVPKIVEADGTAMLTRVLRLEHLALLEGDMRESALQALITGDANSLQNSFEFPDLERTVDPATGEVSSQPVASYAEPAPEFVHGSEDPVEVAHHAPTVSHEDEQPEGTPHPDLDDDVFDVPVAKDDSEITGTQVVGHVRVGGTPVPSGGDEGPKVGQVDYSELESISATPTQSGLVPQGDVVGSVHRPGKSTDKHLEDFFSEADPRG